jgi:PHD/YefM family antitoxin component YafN of YafNO toxin-antitoxin module
MITANDIKTKGVKAIEDGLSKDDRLSVSVRGKVKYIILKADDYEHLRLAELEMAYKETISDIEKGKFKIETTDQHLERLWKSQGARDVT